MTAPFRPLGDRVLIQPDLAPTTTASGLHLAEHWKPEQTGTVVTVGLQCTLVKPGDYVVFSWQVGQEVFVEETRYFVMREENILAVVEESPV